jgi:hypothetical protein
MKTVLLILALSAAAFAQDLSPTILAGPTISVGTLTVSVPSVTVTIADQGSSPMQLITGVKVATATLLDATSCNETDTDESVDNSMVYQRINSLTTQSLTLYDSQVVSRVLTVFQDKSVYQKLFRAGPAASTVGVILTTALHLNPMLSLSLAIAPQIYSAILPVVHSPEDLQALIADIVPQNAGGKLAGHSCRSGLVIARTTAPVTTEVIRVQ